MHYCLNKQELNQLIEFKAHGKEVNARKLAVWIEESHDWNVELGCLNYLFAQILEGKRHRNQDWSHMIPLMYNLVNDMYIRIHECDSEFTTYMLMSMRDSNLSLDEQLIILHNDMCDYRYE